MINLGIVGLGRWGRRHAESAIASGRFRVVRAATPHPDCVADFAAARSIRLCTDVEELLADPRVDAVSLATPHTLHAAQTIQAAEARKHVLTEKPFALTQRDAERAIEACSKAGVVVAVGHDNRFYSAIAEVQKVLEAGTIGTVIHAEANLSHDFAQKKKPKKGGANEQVNWRDHKDEAPAGSIVHLGVHRVDSFVQLFGEISEIYAQASRPVFDVPFADSVAVLVRFKNGMTGMVASSIATPLNSRIQVFGTKGAIEATGPFDKECYLVSSLDKVRVRLENGTCEIREFRGADSVRRNFEAFADAIEGKSPYPVSGEEMINVAAVVEAIGRSLQTGQPISVTCPRLSKPISNPP